MTTFWPCPMCLAGHCDQCAGGTCACHEDHAGDSPVMRGFKRLKRMTPEARRVEVERILKEIREGRRS